MSEIQIRVDGDRWKVRMSRERAGPGKRAVVFFPQTTDQRPYRVVEVPTERVGSAEALASLSDRELEELFHEARSMGFPGSYA